MTGTASRATGEQSGVEQVKEKVQDVAEQAKGQTREQVRSQISDRSSQAGDQLVSAAQALRRSADQLRSEGNDRAAEAVEALVTRAERLGGYLRVADGDRILRDIEDFGRRQPWLMVGGSAVAGFLASRFMKASSSGRYRGTASYASGYPQRLPSASMHGGDGRASVGAAGSAGGAAGGLG
ncbi:MAG TPA: hypothetical protein VGC78_00405 [Gaiellaceae bacterium]|jgi:hypothetical protein